MQREYSIALYIKATVYALSRGGIVADTKFEIGTVDGKIIRINEVLPPDSSRFWTAENDQPGRPRIVSINNS